ncbi:Ribophorin I-domain-containing protein [Phlyctochytrium arcticum]|nr:Ribophorin I-domain-containing protein [Phlyctochytrium arcticum]
MRGNAFILCTTLGFLLLCVCTVLATPITQDFINHHVNYDVDLGNPTIAREKITVKVEGTSSKGSDVYYLAFEDGIAKEHLALVQVADARKPKEHLVVKKEPKLAKDGFTYCSVKLPMPLAKGDALDLVVNTAIINVVSPYPKEIELTKTQQLKYERSPYFLSPYTTQRGHATIRLPKDHVVSYKETPAPVLKSGSTIKYGPYSNIAPLTLEKTFIHYDDNQPILIATNVEKKVELSMWGKRLNVQEDWELHHEGAHLKGHFSRVDFLLTQRMHQITNVVKDITVNLPPKAQHIFFRDTIGNVSTSQIRYEKERTQLLIRPRYPLYGGWRYTWHHGYAVSSSNYLKHDYKTGRYALSVPFLGSISGVGIQNAKIEIVLPEGAEGVNMHLPFPMDEVTESRSYSYLDTTGRPTIVLQKSLLTDEHAQNIVITFDFPKYRLLQKPLAASGLILGLFLAVSLYTRLDLSITKDPKAEQDAILRVYRNTVHGLAKTETKLVNRMRSTFEYLKTDRRLAEYADAIKETETDLKAGWDALLSAAKGTEHKGASFSRQVRRLHALQQDRLGKTKAMHLEIAEIAKAGQPVDDSRRKSLTAGLAKHESEIQALEKEIERLLIELDG